MVSTLFQIYDVSTYSASQVPVQGVTSASRTRACSCLFPASTVPAMSGLPAAGTVGNCVTRKVVGLAQVCASSMAAFRRFRAARAVLAAAAAVGAAALLAYAVVSAQVLAAAEVTSGAPPPPPRITLNVHVARITYVWRPACVQRLVLVLVISKSVLAPRIFRSCRRHLMLRAIPEYLLSPLRWGDDVLLGGVSPASGA